MFVGEGATAHRLVSDGQSISSSSVQSANNKMPVSSVFNDTLFFFYKNIFYKNIETEICEILRIF